MKVPNYSVNKNSNRKFSLHFWKDMPLIFRRRAVLRILQRTLEHIYNSTEKNLAAQIKGDVIGGLS